jgi:hypothetical protein
MRSGVVELVRRNKEKERKSLKRREKEELKKLKMTESRLW